MRSSVCDSCSSDRDTAFGGFPGREKDGLCRGQTDILLDPDHVEIKILPAPPTSVMGAWDI